MPPKEILKLRSSYGVVEKNLKKKGYMRAIKELLEIVKPKIHDLIKLVKKYEEMGQELDSQPETTQAKKAKEIDEKKTNKKNPDRSPIKTRSCTRIQILTRSKTSKTKQ